MTTKTFKRALALAVLALVVWSTAPAQTTPAYVSLQTDDLRGIKYTWPITNTDAVNQAADREGNLADVVYVSDNYQDMSVAQAIALIRKVYMDPQVPGIWYRGYTADSPTTNYGSGQKEGSVMYQGVGQISCDVTVSQSGNTYTYNYSSSWADTYGWNIPGAIASNLRDQQSTSGLFGV